MSIHLSYLTAIFIKISYEPTVLARKEPAYISCVMRCRCSTSRRSTKGNVAARKGYKSRTRLPRISQRCSNGDRSGDLDG